jgi:hypothetical protein
MQHFKINNVDIISDQWAKSTLGILLPVCEQAFNIETDYEPWLSFTLLVSFFPSILFLPTSRIHIHNYGLLKMSNSSIYSNKTQKEKLQSYILIWIILSQCILLSKTRRLNISMGNNDKWSLNSVFCGIHGLLQHMQMCLSPSGKVPNWTTWDVLALRVLFFF